MSEWKESRLGNYIKIKHGFAFKGKYITTEENEDILVTPGNFNIGGGFKSTKMKYFTGEYPEEYILNHNDIVVTMTDLSKETDTLGYSAKVPKSDNKRYLHNQRIGLVQFKNNDIDKEYLYWLMRTREYQGYIVGSASGTSIMHTSPTRIEDYTCLLPTLKEQKAIAEVLSSLDDKIDLLHRQNKTLEELAQTLFRQWFIEEAKDEWEVGTIGDITILKSGKSRPKEESLINQIPIYGGNGILGYTNQFNAEDESIIIGRVGAYCGSLYLESQPIWVSDNALLAKGKDTLFTKFLFYTLKNNELNSMAEGSSHPLLTQGLIKSIPLLIPPVEKLEEFNIQVNSWYKKINFNKRQIKTLENMRDTLLPKLMSGEFKVKDD